MGSAMDTLLAKINKDAKEEILTKGLAEYSGYTRIPFTSPRMNYCTFGGIPVGKLTEFFGEEHGGKTTTTLDIVANFQALESQKAQEDATYVEKAVLYCDCENTLDREWASKLHVDVDKMYLLQPKTQSAEEIFELIMSAIQTGEIGFFVIDSIGAMVSKQEFSKTLDEKTYGGISGPLTVFSKKVEMLMAKYKCTGIGINQMRDDLASSWGGYKTPGGKAWKHLCTVRIQFSRGKFFDEEGKELTRGAESPAGNYVMITMHKNKTCPPTRRTGFYTLRYDIGVDYLADLIEVALKYEIVKKDGSWFSIIDEQGVSLLKVQGQAKVYEALSEDENLLEYVESHVNDMIQ